MYFRLFSTSIIVKGATRSTICDVQKNRYLIIPNKLADILNHNQAKRITLDNLYLKNLSEKEGLKKYIEWLIEDQYGFLTPIPEAFPNLNLQWYRPSNITNAILDFDNNSKYYSRHLIDDFVENGCAVFQLRFFKPIADDVISEIVMAFNSEPGVENIELVIPYHQDYKNLVSQNSKVTNVVLYSAAEDKSFYDESLNCMVNLISKNDINEKSCGVIDESSFSCNMATFTESQKFNSCLNRKIGIDVNGNFGNCPAMTLKYGNVKRTKVQTVLNNKKYAFFGKINKDKIKVCQDCEFRYICSDCRAFTQDSKDIYSKPAKCKYDPYLAEWK